MIKRRTPFCLLIMLFSLGMKIAHAQEGREIQPGRDSLVVDSIEIVYDNGFVDIPSHNHVFEEDISPIDNILQNKTEQKIKFFKRLRKHYKRGKGEDFILDAEEFDYMISKGRILWTGEQLGKDSCYIMYIKFYDSANSPNDLKFSFGTSTVKYSIQSNRFVAFHDKYDFDWKPIGQRHFLLEWLTRITGVFFRGTPFEIYYNKSYFIKE